MKKIFIWIVIILWFVMFKIVILITVGFYECERYIKIVCYVVLVEKKAYDLLFLRLGKFCS